MTGNARRRPARAGVADRRTLRTRGILHQALMRLIRERGYDAISIVDIADAANVGRSTFYAHFTGKDDLLQAGLDHLRALLRAEHAALPPGDAGERMLAFCGFMTAHLQEQHQLYRGLVRSRAGPIIIDRIRDLLLEAVRGEFTPRRDRSAGRPAATEITARFVVGAYLSVVTWWLDRGARQPPEEINQAFRALALDGLRALSRDRRLP